MVSSKHKDRKMMRIVYWFASLTWKIVILIMVLQLPLGCAELPRLEVMTVDNASRVKRVGTLHSYFFLDTLLRSSFVFEGAGINSLGFSPDGNLLAWGDYRGNIHVWRLKPLRREVTIKATRVIAQRFDRDYSPSPDSVQCLAISPDDNLLISTGWGILLWGIPSGKLSGAIRRIDKEKQGLFDIYKVVFTPDSSKVILAGDAVSLYDVQNQKLLSIPVEANALPPSENASAFKLDAGLIAVGDAGRLGIIKVLRLEPPTEIATFDIGNERISSIAISPDAKMVAATSRTAASVETLHGRIGVWQIDPAQDIARFEFDTKALHHINFSPDGKMIAASCGKDIILWRVGTEKRLDVLKGHSGSVDFLAFGRNGKLLVSASKNEHCDELDKEIERLTELGKKKGKTNLEMLRKDHIIEQAMNKVKGLGTIRFWDVEKSREIQAIPIKVSHGPNIAFSPDGQLIATSDEELEAIFLYGVPGQ